MPIAPKRPCRHPGCGAVVTSGRCEVHQAKVDDQRRTDVKRYDQQRGSAAARGYDARWTRYSKRYRHDHPLCVDCLAIGILTSVEYGGHVDHIIPVSGPDDPLFWDETNHQSLCAFHHRSKSAREDGALGNTKADKPRK